MSGTGNRRLIGWLGVLLALLLVGGFLTYEQFSAMFQALIGVKA